MFYKDISDAGQHLIDNENTNARINVWMISDEDMGPMITKILKPEDLEYTFAIIMPDLEHPWDIMNQCEKWMKVLKDAIYTLSPKLELKKLDFLKERVIDMFKTYEEP